MLITCQALYIHTDSYSILPTMPKRRSYYSQIINGVTEAQRGYKLAQGHTARNEQSQGLNWGLLSSELWTPGAASHCHLREPTSKLCASVRFSLMKKEFLGSRGLLPLSRFSRVRLCATPEMAAHQASPSLGFSRQEHWSGLPFPSPDLFVKLL